MQGTRSSSSGFLCGGLICDRVGVRKRGNRGTEREKAETMKQVGKIIIIIMLCAAVWFAWQQYQDAKAAYAPLDQGQIEEIYDIQNLPAYSGDPAVEINGGRPDFAAEDLEAKFFEKLSPLDDLGRCGAAEACLDRWHMPEGERGEIETIRPSGWQTATYDFIDNEGYLYNGNLEYVN